MSDYREQLEQERRRHRMPDDSFQRLQARRDRKRRTRMITSGLLALVVAAAGGTGVVLAFRNTGTAPRPVATPTSESTTVAGPPVEVTIPATEEGGPVSSSILYLDKSHGWYVQPDGTLAHDTGGPQPDVLEFGAKIVGVAFVVYEHGWALGADKLFRTTDGQSWKQVGEAAEPLRTIQFVTADVGWGVAGPPNSELPGNLVRTSNGGDTWESVDTPAPVDSVCMTSSDIGWAAGGRTVFRTLDAGKSWDRTDLDVPVGEGETGGWAATLACASERDAFALLTDGGAAGHIAYVLFHTSDGTTWEPVAQEAGTSPVGQRRDVYASVDPYPGPFVTTGPGSLAFVTWCPACGNSVALLRTSDGGKTWDRLQVAAPDAGGGEPQGASFIDPDNGWILLTVQTDKGPEPGVAKVVGSTVTVSSQKTVP